jgi:pre-60S factor REI1
VHVTTLSTHSEPLMLSCTTCGVSFDGDAKAHYGQTFHLANLKRRVADLPPLTEAAFARMCAAEASSVAAAQAASESVLYICDACGKRFYSEGQFSAHNGSRKHRDRVRELIAAQRAIEAEEAERERSGGGGGGGGGGAVDDGDEEGEEEEGEEGEEGEEEEEVTHLNCVFCWAASESVEANLVHMRQEHSFYVPDVEYCVNPAGLIERMHELVIEEGKCLLCETKKQYSSPTDCQRHMADKAHCRILYNEERHFEAWEEFYDYEGYGEEKEGVGEEVGTLDEQGALVLPGGRVAYSKEVAMYLKQRVAMPDQRDSVRTVMGRLAVEYGVGGGGEGKGGGGVAPSAAAIRAAAARRVGTRGNLTDANAQLREQKARKYNDFLVGMNQNHIRRRWFRVQTTLTGVSLFFCHPLFLLPCCERAHTHVH